MKMSRVASLMMSAAFLVGTAAAMSLDDDPTVFYQQTAASPCVIGGQNCLNGGFPQTLSGAGGEAGDIERYSPIYAIGDIAGIVADIHNITIGIDYNQTNTDQILYEFTVFACAGPAGVGGSLCSGSSIIDSFNTETTLGVHNNGVGWSDFLLTDLDLGDADYVQFFASWMNNDGADRYFLVGCDPEAEECGSDQPPVPEPSSMLLMGGGLLGLAWWRKRKTS